MLSADADGWTSGFFRAVKSYAAASSSQIAVMVATNGSKGLPTGRASLIAGDVKSEGQLQA